MERGDVERPFYTADLTIDDVDTWTPVLDIGFDDRVIQLHHFNTVVRLFENEDANHVEIRHEKVLKGVRMAQDIMDMMIAYDYSYRWDKRLDSATEDWLVAIQSSELQAEIDDL